MSKKAAFVRRADLEVFIREERRKRPWLRHSVALLIVSPRVDQIALGLPKKAADRGGENVRVPPQRRLEPAESVRTVAVDMASQVLSVRVPSAALQYLGSGRGNAYRANAVDSYGKWIHWIGLHMQDYHVLRSAPSGEFQFVHWCATNQVLGMDEYAMSERKYLLTLQALAAFTALGVEGQLTHRAHRRLAS